MKQAIAAFSDEEDDGMVDDFEIKMMANLIGRLLTDAVRWFKYFWNVPIRE